MYALVLWLHSWIRWLALAAGIGATVAALNQDKSAGVDRADRWGLALVISVDIQLLLGLLLYFVVSPNMQAIRADFSAAMRRPDLRFWAVEHLTMMLAAVVLVHVGRVLARKARTPAARRIRMLLCFGLATLLMLVATPWPGLRAGRPLFRLG